IIILKAFTKIFSMAGLSLGYAILGDITVAENVKNTGQYWSVSVPAQMAGTVALDEKKYLEKTVEFIEKERQYITRNFLKSEIKVFDSEANFIFFRCEKNIYELLKNSKILIRNCENYKGLSSGFFRVAVRTHEENIMLVSAVRRIFNG
ncbi:MAG: aminotransferase class I/II-fold pyridoxal phosphate-dependent enzyme, partial [Ruminococcus sp.]|nr:aminotransferase class I/II-fold pyridoxal phosphate-dependent enzyme [Ruminococcus sp.]